MSLSEPYDDRLMADLAAAADGTLPRARQQELEADSLGVRYLSRVGYDPDAMASFLETLHAQSVIDAEMKGLPPGKVDEFNIMATHPRTIDRVEQAKHLLATTKRSATQIATDTGFCDLPHLIRVFRATEGMTPEAFRRIHMIESVIAIKEATFDALKFRSTMTLVRALPRVVGNVGLGGVPDMHDPAKLDHDGLALHDTLLVHRHDLVEHQRLLGRNRRRHDC
jgi:hypothetical protein